MTSNIGPANITPAPSIHNVLLRDSGAPNPLDPKFFEQTGEVFLELFLAQVALALGNVTILGVKPFAFLTTWGENLETLATTANDDLADLIDGVLGTGHTFSELATFLTDIPGDVQAVRDAIAHALGHTGAEPYSNADIFAFLGEIPGSVISGALNTAVTISGNALSTLFNTSGLIASEIAGALNTAVTISGNALSTLFNGSGTLASALTGAINTAVTVSGNAISTLFNGSGALASALTGAVNTAVTISGNAISTLFNGSGVIASQIAGALNTAVTIGGTALSTLFQYLDSLGQFSAAHITGALNTAITVSGNAISALFNGSGLIASQIAGALNTAITISGNAISSLFNSSGVLASIVNGALNTAVTISGNALSALFNSSGVLASVVNGALNTAVTISGNAISTLFNGSGVLASIVNGALNTAVTISGNAVSTLFNGSGLIASQIAGALNTAVTISGNAISTLFSASGVLGSAITGAINTAATISGKALSTLFNASGLIASQIAGALNTAVTISGNAISALFNGSGVLASALTGAINTAVTISGNAISSLFSASGVLASAITAVLGGTSLGADLSAIATGLYNGLTGAGASSTTSSQVATATTAVATTVGSHASSISNINSQLTNFYGGSGALNVTETFSGSLPGDFTALTSGVTIATHAASYNVATSFSDTQQVTGIWSAPPPSGGYYYLFARANSAFSTYLYLKLGQTTWELGTVVSGTKTVFASGSATFTSNSGYQLTPGNSNSGTPYIIEYFVPNAGVGTASTYNDSTHVSQVGSTFRNAGYGTDEASLPGAISSWLFCDTVFSGPGTATNTGTANSSSTSYGALSNSPSVTVNIGPTGMAMVLIFSAMVYSSGTGPKAYTSFATISGVNTITATDNRATRAHFQSSVTDFAAGAPFLLTGLTPGTTQIALEARVSTGTCTFGPWSIAVIPL